MHCARCGSESPKDAVTCVNCGASFSAVEGERRQLTVLFCDLVGSTALSLALDPEELSDVVRSYQTRCAGVVSAEGGYIAQYLGDGILVYFGYPEAHEDDSRRAVRTGLNMVLQVNSLFARGRRLQVRVGIHTGVVVVGPIGSGPASQRLALGEAPNIAARVQAQAQPGEVLTTDSTRRLVQGYFVLEDLGERDLAGSGKPRRLFRVREETGALSRLEAGRTAGLTPFVGREREIGLVLEHSARRANGEGKVLLVRGDAGIGKSRLFEVVKDGVVGQGAQFFQTYCSPMRTNSPLFPVTSLFWHWLGLKDQDDGETQARLNEALAASGSSDPKLIASLLSIFAAGEVTPPVATTPQRRLRLVLRTIYEWLTTVATKAPVVLLLEDVHWADPTTLDLIELFVTTPHSRILLCVTARPEFDASWIGHPGLVEVKLGPLSRGEVGEIASSVAGHRLTDSVANGLYAETDGIPLFVEEVTRARLEAGLLGSPAEDRVAVSAGQVAIPAGLNESLMARLDRLGSAKQLAQRASILGREFDGDLLAAVANSDEYSITRDLHTLISSGLLVRTPGSTPEGYAFKHALIRDAAYVSLLRPARQDYHRRAAMALMLSSSATRQPDIIAVHLEEGGDEREAARYWQLAGVNALGRSSNREAIAHLQRALRLTEGLPDTAERRQAELLLHLAIAPAFMAINGWASSHVETSCLRALALGQELGALNATLQALWGLWSVHLVRGETNRALADAEQLFARTQAIGSPPHTVMAHHALGFSRYYLGDLAGAREHAEAGIALFSLAQEKAIVEQIQLSSTVIIGGFLSLVLWLQGHPEEADRRLEEAYLLAQQLAHPPSLAFHLSLRAELYFWHRDAERLRNVGDRLLALADAEGFELFASTARWYRGWARACLEDLPGGISDAAQAWKMYAKTGAVVNIGHGHCELAELLLRAGRLDEALSVLDTAERSSRDLGGEKVCDAELHRVRGETMAQRGATAAADASLRRAVEIARGQGAKALEVRAAASLARLSERVSSPAEDQMSSDAVIEGRLGTT